MWKRDEPVQTVTPQVASTTRSVRRAGSRANRDVIIGKSVVVKGELHGGEDLTIEGQVEGKITLERHVLTIGTHGRIRAEVFAKSVVVLGEVVGDIAAAETVSIGAEGTVEGNIKAAPRRHRRRSQVPRRHRHAAGAAGPHHDQRTEARARVPAPGERRAGQVMPNDGASREGERDPAPSGPPSRRQEHPGYARSAIRSAASRRANRTSASIGVP